MKTRFLVVGKIDEEYLRLGINEYENRIKRYVPFETTIIPAIKSGSNWKSTEIRKREGEKLTGHIAATDVVIILDETGKEMNSVEFAGFLQQRFSSGVKNMIFITGGAFGIDESVRRKAHFCISLSRMTFSHQMVRLIFLEQFYRALTILNNESYHH